MDVIILAGGKGTRMDSDLPKVLVEVRGKSILGRQLDYVSKFPEVKKIILALGYKAGAVIDYVYRNYSHFRIPILFSVEDEPLGTGGAMKKALLLSDSEKVLAFNCDDITDLDISSLSRVAENTICVTNPRLPFGRIYENDGYAKFEEKPILRDTFVSCGWYLLNRREIFEHLPDNGSIEYDTFPRLKLRVFKHEGYWKPLTSKKEVGEFETEPIPFDLE